MTASHPAQDTWPRERFRTSIRTNGGADGNCVAVAAQGDSVAVGDTKLPKGESFQHVRVSVGDFGGLVAGIKSGMIA